MDLRKCCVGNCPSTNRTHRLFFLPKDDNLRELWLTYLIPTNVKLSGLTKNQLLTKRVCQDHFDRYQFDGMGNRLCDGYPCLFSAKEIRYGIPLSSTDGTIEISGQKLNVVFDPPYLLKGLRNNFVTKNMIFNGAIATWDDILTIYRADCQLGHTRMDKKLKDHHVIASKMKKMKVSVAANVLSERTSAMLKYTALFSTTVAGEKVSATMKTTGEAVEFIDKLFDSVNGSKRNTTKGKLRGPIKPNSEHFEFWRKAITTLKNIKFVDSLARTLARSINQDPLENFFGRIRAMNYRNVNPDTYTFVDSFKSLLISNVMGPHSIYANCEADDGQNIVNFYNLLKEEVDFDDKENVSSGIFPDNHENLLSETFSLSLSKEIVNTHAKLSLDLPEQSQTPTVDSITAAINERVRVHTSAYTAGYLCRKLTKKNHELCMSGIVLPGVPICAERPDFQGSGDASRLVPDRDAKCPDKSKNERKKVFHKKYIYAT